MNVSEAIKFLKIVESLGMGDIKIVNNMSRDGIFNAPVGELHIVTDKEGNKFVAIK